MANRPNGRREQIELAESMRAQGQPWTAIATALRSRFRVNGRVAMRLAHGWSQNDVADHWNERWPDEPKTFKNISYWENWPSPTGYAPSLQVLERLAQLYQCSIADLIVDWGDHRAADVEYGSSLSQADPGILGWQVQNLSLPQLTHVLAEWSDTLPSTERRWLLLKLSTAAAAAARRTADDDDDGFRIADDIERLAGRWQSRYRYRSTSRDAEFECVHDMSFRAERGRLLGHSEHNETHSELDMELCVDGLLATGSWSERTSPAGHYRAATYRGSVEFVLDPTGRSMRGKWLGLGKHFVVNSGDWDLTWIGSQQAATGRL